MILVFNFGRNPFSLSVWYFMVLSGEKFISANINNSNLEPLGKTLSIFHGSSILFFFL